MPLSWLTQEEQQILQQVLKDGPVLQEILTEAKAISLREERCCTATTKTLGVINGKLDQILQLLAPPLPVGFNVTIERITTKAAKK